MTHENKMPSPCVNDTNHQASKEDARQTFVNNGYLRTATVSGLPMSHHRNNSSTENGLAMDEATGVLLEEKNLNGPPSSKSVIVNFGPGSMTRTSVAKSLSVRGVCHEPELRKIVLIIVVVSIIIGALFGALISYLSSTESCDNGKYKNIS